MASYASDGRPIYDCATLDFQEDNLGYTLKETYVVLELGNRTQKSYLARVDPTFDAGNKAQFIVSYENAGEFSFFQVIIFFCEKKINTTYIFYARHMSNSWKTVM